MEALQHRESTGKAVTAVTVEPTRDDSGWISYEGNALVTHHDGDAPGPCSGGPVSGVLHLLGRPAAPRRTDASGAARPL
ncbi:hypothetical protein ACFVRD_33015 [Streptomyces sp. NPDC057908]|uniref:hypothetical protein n=1 Tax=Streptomyces sp. NPDC057908 TaxID=3346276 RepID=UPI0036EEC19F